MTDRQLCTAENPMPKDDPGYWKHEGARETDSDSDYYIEYQCKHCGQKWRTEMPD